jgi:hypothetical protein
VPRSQVEKNLVFFPVREEFFALKIFLCFLSLKRERIKVMIPFFSPLTLTLSPNGERESMKMSYCLTGKPSDTFSKNGDTPAIF